MRRAELDCNAALSKYALTMGRVIQEMRKGVICPKDDWEG